MMLLLQAKARFGLALNPLNLKSTSLVDAVVPAAGAVHFAGKGVLFAFCFLPLGDDVFDVLAAGFVGYQDGIWRFHHDQTKLTSRLVTCTKVFLLSVVNTSPKCALPASSFGKTFQTVSQAPRSLQPALSGTILMG